MYRKTAHRTTTHRTTAHRTRGRLFGADPATPLGFLVLLLHDRRARLAASVDRGASAIEWVVISALLIGIALALGLVIQRKVLNKADSLNLDGP
jgi:hypothetical protein